MEELEALNMLLRAVGSSPVNALNAPQPDVANAVATLDRYRARVQNRGWWFNIDYNVQFTRASDNQIRVPKGYTTLVFSNANYIARGTRLYDKLNQTYLFTENPVAVRTVYTLPWNELPNSVQEHIAYTACASYVMDELEDARKAAKFEEQAGISALDVKKEDLEQGQYNTFNKPRVQNARAGTIPYHGAGNGQVLFNGTSQYE